MEAEREQFQSWRIHVTSKANNFNFRFRFTATSLDNPTWTLSLCRFSIVLKLRKFVFRIHSHPTQSFVQPKNRVGFFRTKVMKIVHKFRARFSKYRVPNIAAKRQSILPYPKDPIHIGIWVMGFLAFTALSISKKDQKGIMMLAFVVYFTASLMFKKFKSAKLTNLAAFLLVVATIVCYMFLHFDNNYWDYMARSAWNKLENKIGYL